MIFTQRFKTRFGFFTITATEKGLYSLKVGGRSQKGQACRDKKDRPQKWLKQAIETVTSYLDGKVVNFKNLPVDFRELKPFEQKVLKELRKVPSGKTVSYQFLAQKAGRPRTARYVGRVMSENRLPIILPCHRVLPKQGGWGGFSAGIHWKKRLLKLESRRADKNSQRNRDL